MKISYDRLIIFSYTLFNLDKQQSKYFQIHLLGILTAIFINFLLRTVKPTVKHIKIIQNIYILHKTQINTKNEITTTIPQNIQHLEQSQLI